MNRRDLLKDVVDTTPVAATADADFLFDKSITPCMPIPDTSRRVTFFSGDPNPIPLTQEDRRFFVAGHLT